MPCGDVGYLAFVEHNRFRILANQVRLASFLCAGLAV